MRLDLPEPPEGSRLKLEYTEDETHIQFLPDEADAKRVDPCCFVVGGAIALVGLVILIGVIAGVIESGGISWLAVAGLFFGLIVVALGISAIFGDSTPGPHVFEFSKDELKIGNYGEVLYGEDNIACGVEGDVLFHSDIAARADITGVSIASHRKKGVSSIKLKGGKKFGKDLRTEELEYIAEAVRIWAGL